ncbi:MAG: cyclic nucleotide-binding domain-containing protein [Deltaproteobacteria bacterium]|nr:cyclic nucleotide-binding domain-containing protein [Deltaproteobacteria bacterium]
MTLDERVAVLGRDPLFRSARLEPAALADVAERLTAVDLRAGCPVFREGDAGDRMYVIAAGKVGIFRQMGNTRVAVAELEAGAHFGELALIDGARRSADADSLSDVSLLALDAAAFDELIERHPRLALAFLRVMSQRLRNTLGRVDDDDENPTATATRTRSRASTTRSWWPPIRARGWSASSTSWRSRCATSASSPPPRTSRATEGRTGSTTSSSPASARPRWARGCCCSVRRSSPTPRHRAASGSRSSARPSSSAPAVPARCSPTSTASFGSATISAMAPAAP